MFDQVFNKLFERMVRTNIAAHGFRRTLKDWARSCKGAEYSAEISELALWPADCLDIPLCRFLEYGKLAGHQLRLFGNKPSINLL